MGSGQADVYVFGDEAGSPSDFRNLGANRYFMVVTATLPDLSWLTQLDQLGRALRGSLAIPHLGLPFHAAKDNPTVKRRVLDLIGRQELRIDATIIDKQVIKPELRRRHRLYAAIWADHLVHLLRQSTPRPSQVDVMVASIGTAGDARLFAVALNEQCERCRRMARHHHRSSV
jgi:hypothetical protein